MNPPDPAPAPVSAPTATSHVARRALLAALLLGILADPLLRNGPWGLGLLAWMVVFAAAAIALVRRSGRPLSRESGIWLAVAVLSATGLAWHDADTVHFFDFLAMLAALVLLAMSLDAVPVTGLAAACVRDLIVAALGTGLEVATGAVPLLLRDAALNTAIQPASLGTTRRIGRALAIAAPIVVVFTVLLASADPVFGSLFRFPNIRVDVLVSHVAIAGFFAWVVAGWLRRSLLARPAAAPPPPPTRRPGRFPSPSAPRTSRSRSAP